MVPTGYGTRSPGAGGQGRTSAQSGIRDRTRNTQGPQIAHVSGVSSPADHLRSDLQAGARGGIEEGGEGQHEEEHEEVVQAQQRGAQHRRHCGRQLLVQGQEHPLARVRQGRLGPATVRERSGWRGTGKERGSGKTSQHLMQQEWAKLVKNTNHTAWRSQAGRVHVSSAPLAALSPRRRAHLCQSSPMTTVTKWTPKMASNARLDTMNTTDRRKTGTQRASAPHPWYTGTLHGGPRTLAGIKARWGLGTGQRGRVYGLGQPPQQGQEPGRIKETAESRVVQLTTTHPDCESKHNSPIAYIIE
jgi:hypothetical protein